MKKKILVAVAVGATAASRAFAQPVRPQAAHSQLRALNAHAPRILGLDPSTSCDGPYIGSRVEGYPRESKCGRGTLARPAQGLFKTA